MQWNLILLIIYFSNNKEVLASTVTFGIVIPHVKTYTEQTNIKNIKSITNEETKTNNVSDHTIRNTNVTIHINETTHYKNITINNETILYATQEYHIEEKQVVKSRTKVEDQLKEALIAMIKNIIKKYCGTNKTNVNETESNDTKTVYFCVENDENTTMISNKSRRAITDPQLQKFLVHSYSSVINILKNLRSEEKKLHLMELVDSGINLFEDQYRVHLLNISNNDSDLNKVLIILDTVNLLTAFKDDLVALAFIKANKISSALRIQKIVYEKFDDLLQKESEYICNEFGVCRTYDSFVNFFINFLNLILKGGTDKAVNAIKSFISVGHAYGNNKKEEDFHLDDIPTESLGSMAVMVWTILRDELKKPDGKFHGEKVSDMEKDFPATPESVSIWKDITKDMEAFSAGKTNDSKPIFEKLFNYTESKKPKHFIFKTGILSY